jgi:2-deoxy-D-gluconate 3-dehydrogenase
MTFPSMRLDGQVAFVTGAGQGLGQAIAVGLAHAGADIVVTELPGKTENAQETARQIEAAGHRAFCVELDVTQMPLIHAAVDRALEHFGRIDILVNNAGTNIQQWAIDVTEDAWDRIVDTNLKGTFFVSQTIAKRAMIPQQRGKIISLASQMGVVGYYYRAAYCASKAGVVNLTRVLAVEWAQYNINVNAIGPTFILTPLARPMLEDPAFRDEVLNRIPLKRFGSPEDVVGAVVYLASPASDLVTGHTLLIDGGWTAW